MTDAARGALFFLGLIRDWTFTSAVHGELPLELHLPFLINYRLFTSKSLAFCHCLPLT